MKERTPLLFLLLSLVACGGDDPPPLETSLEVVSINLRHDVDEWERRFALIADEIVRLGITSSVRSVERFSIPVICPACPRVLTSLREMGIQESCSPSRRWMMRKTCTPHSLPFPARYLSDLKGTATSTV